jgi:REP element-mobilizing transposase RayT
MRQKTASSLFRRRSRPLRIENDEFLWFVTSRTIEERFWLHPLLTSAFMPANHQARRVCKALERQADRRLAKIIQRANAMRGPLQPELTLADAKRIAKGLIGSAIARAQQKYKTKVFALVAMSDHLQMVVQTKGKNLSKFMGYVKSRITEAINLLTGKRGPLWSRRYDAQPILDDEATEDRVAYCLDNPVDAGLVESADSWPGLNLAYGMGESDAIEFEYLDRTAWHKAGRPEQMGDYYRTATLRLSPLPQLVGMERKLVRESITSWLGKRAIARGKGTRALGIEGIFSRAFESRPKHADKSRRPYAFGSKENKATYYQGVSILYHLYATASERFRTGKYNVAFPEGMYHPPISVAA